MREVLEKNPTYKKGTIRCALVNPTQKTYNSHWKYENKKNKSELTLQFKDHVFKQIGVYDRSKIFIRSERWTWNVVNLSNWEVSEDGVCRNRTTGTIIENNKDRYQSHQFNIKKKGYQIFN